MQTIWTREKPEPAPCPEWCQHYTREHCVAVGDVAEGVAFDWLVTGADGANLILLPTSEQGADAIAAADDWARIEYAVISAEVQPPDPPCAACGRRA